MKVFTQTKTAMIKMGATSRRMCHMSNSENKQSRMIISAVIEVLKI